jgi:hypothetical protein
MKGNRIMQYATLKEKISAEKNARASRYAEFQALADRAREAGLQAGIEASPVPMHVIDELRGQLWRVDDGACGFAWVKVKPANSSFAIWAKARGLMSPAYGGGVDYWVTEFGQSVARKEAFANAYAAVLREAGINAYAGSRLD